MKALNYWQQFLETGSPKDYLEFKEKEQDVQKKPAWKAGEYAGNDNYNRNYIEDGAYRGLR